MAVLVGFIRKEFRQSLRDPSDAEVDFFGSDVAINDFGFALNSETHNIKMAVFGPPVIKCCCVLIDKAIASGWFKN